MEFVILVDQEDRPVGTMEKMEAHEKALCHRAFSVFIHNERNEILIQQRAAHKYHCPELWANTCCSHPREGEATIDAAHRRLQEEMGFDCEIEEQFSFYYKAEFDNGLTEHEYDHVFIGCYSGEIELNANEVMAYKWIKWSDLIEDVEQNPHIYTPWFLIILDKLKNKNIFLT